MACPLMIRFWALRSDEAAAWLRQHSSNANHPGYRWGASPTPRQAASDKGCIIMSNGKESVVVPRIGLLPNGQLDYADIKRDVQDTRVNSRFLNDSRMLRPWTGIISNLYTDSSEELRKAILSRVSRATHAPYRSPLICD